MCVCVGDCAPHAYDSFLAAGHPLNNNSVHFVLFRLEELDYFLLSRDAECNGVVIRVADVFERNELCCNDLTGENANLL